MASYKLSIQLHLHFNTEFWISHTLQLLNRASNEPRGWEIKKLYIPVEPDIDILISVKDKKTYFS